MRTTLLTAALTFLPALAVAGAAAPPADAAPAAESPAAPQADAAPGPFGLTGTLQERFEALVTNEFAPELTTSVSDAHIKDAFVDLHFIEGRIVPLRTAVGPVIGGWFTGTCTASYAPPLGQETAQFERGTGKRKWEAVPCDEAFFLTSDPEVLEAVGVPASAIVEPGAEPAADPPDLSAWVKRIRKAQEIWKEPKRFHADLAASALMLAAGVREAWADDTPYLDLTIHTTESAGRPVYWPKREQLNGISYTRDQRGPFATHEAVLVAAFHSGTPEHRYSTQLTSHPMSGKPESAYVPPNMDMVDAKLDLDISTGIEAFATMEATATVTLTSRETPIEAVELILLRHIEIETGGYGKLKLGFIVSEVTDYKGRPLDFLHRGGSLIVRLLSPVAPGQAEILTIKYAGDAMPRLTEDSFGLLANYPWWPQPGSHDRFTWGVEICVPSLLRAAGTGTTLRSWTEKGKRCEEWKEEVPVSFPAINMGRWRVGERKGPHGVAIRAFFLSEDSDQMDAALLEADRILRFYESIFGPYPFAELDLAQAVSNQGFWQAPAGLVELSKSQGQVAKSAKKQRRRDFIPNASPMILSHELGHQWWGHVMGWKTYRDQWISETMAEYASFLYMSQYYGEDDYSGRLEWWQHVARKTDKYGPMSLGFRIGRAYQGQVYNKGPHVMHMLRRIVGDDAFIDFVRTAASAAANRNFGTGDLQIVAEKVLGPDANWFFDQWIWGTGLPRLQLVWQEKGKAVEVVLKQTQATPALKLQIPVVLHGGKKGRKELEHVIATDAREITVQLAMPPGGLSKVSLDPGNETLTRSKRVRRADEEEQPPVEEAEEEEAFSPDEVDGPAAE